MTHATPSGFIQRLTASCRSLALIPLLTTAAASIPDLALAEDTTMPQTPAGYESQTAWRSIQTFLPADFQLSPTHMPAEEWFPWHGHQLHLDTYRNPQAKVKVILFHGVGTNGRQMTMILGAPLARRGYETIAVDMPGYGMTQVAPGTVIKYDDWVQAGSDLINAELARDNRPIVLYGLSAGGMLTYHVAAKNRKVKGIVGMTFLDQNLQQVRDDTASSLFMSRVGGFFNHVAAKTPLDGLRIPMTLASKMDALVNNDAALKVFLKDKTSAGNSVSLAFLDSYMNYKPDIAPEDFKVCPILLTQPAKDRWTPLALSEPFLQRIHQVPVKIVMLENAGHYPLEQPGLSQMVSAIDGFYQQVAGTHP